MDLVIYKMVESEYTYAKGFWDAERQLWREDVPPVIFMGEPIYHYFNLEGDELVYPVI